MGSRLSRVTLLALVAAVSTFSYAQARVKVQVKEKLAVLPSQRNGQSQVSSGLSPLPLLAQSRVSATVGRDFSGYHATENGEGFHAENLRQQLAADFTQEGVKVTHRTSQWTMLLLSYGYGDISKKVARVSPQAGLNRVEYRHGPLTEWYLNGPVGLEQGFTLDQPPTGAKGQPLTISLLLSGDLSATVDQEGTALSLSRNDLRKPELQYAGLAAHDSSGKELQAWLELNGSELRLRVQDAGARYPVVVDPLVQLAELTASDGVSGNLLGISVGISGDTVVAGAVNATVGSNQGQGAAYVFIKPATGWANMTESAKLTASDGQAGDGFGGSVSIRGNTIVVGACSQSGICNGAGKVYVFIKPKSGWKTTANFKAELTASDGTATDGFSNMMGISADHNTVVVGASGATVRGQVSEGAAYVFVKPRGGWVTMTETAKLTEPDGAAHDEFGNVSVSGNGATVFVGAFQANVSTLVPTGPGKAYIFVRPARGWKTTSKFKAKLTASDGAVGDFFGFCQAGSVCISSDGTTVLAGAPQLGSTTGPTGPGKAYVFVRPESGWATTSEFQAELTASDGQIGDAFGWSAAIRDNSAVVGAVNGGSGRTGAAYLFVKPLSGWETTSTFNASLIPSDGVIGDAFAFSVGISGNTVVAGAINHPSGSNPGPGAAYVFGP
jgi:hypothetical protein